LTKSGGYITKIVTFDTKNVPNDEDDRPQPFAFQILTEINISRSTRVWIYALLKDPIAKISVM
jgi:hypothetical protein